MKSSNSFCSELVDSVVMKNSVISLLKPGDRFSIFMEVFTVSIFCWNKEFFLFSSEMYKAILPIIRPLAIELIIRIGITTSISVYSLGQTSPTPNK